MLKKKTLSKKKWFFIKNALTQTAEYGLMRPVARIAQSVEQGIENPRVLGSIPSPGTTYLKNPPKRRFFAFLATVDFRSLQHVIYLLDFMPFLQMFFAVKDTYTPS